VILAHFGHWYISLPTYMAPVALLTGWVKWADHRQRKAKEKARAERKRRSAR
jgi:hypothetical protein